MKITGSKFAVVVFASLFACIALVGGLGCSVAQDEAARAAENSSSKSARLQAGALDPTFGIGGKVTTVVGTGSAEITGIALQKLHGKNGQKYVVSGTASNGSDLDFVVARYNQDGTLDPSFGTGGLTQTNIGTGNDATWGLGIQHDGKIVVAGYAYNGRFKNFAVVRYTVDGDLDTTFGSGGKVLTAIGPGSSVGRAIALDHDRIIVGGYSARKALDTPGGRVAASATDTFTVVRYDSNGNLDGSFGDGGIVTFSSIPEVSRVHGEMLVNEDGQLIAGGVLEADEVKYDVLTVRFNDDGTLDSSFGSGGMVTTRIGPKDDVPLSSALQEDGKILQAGYSTTAVQNFMVVRHNADGSPDTSFGVNGAVVTPFADGALSAVRGVALQEDGKIVALGRAGGTKLEFAVARYTSAGELDTTFAGGTVLTDFGTGSDKGNAVLIYKRRIIGGGVSGPRFALAAYGVGNEDDD